MASDGHDDDERALSVVPSNHGLAAASTSSIAPLVGAGQSPRVSSSPKGTTRGTEAREQQQGLDVIGTSNAVKKLFSMSLDALSSSPAKSTSGRNAKKPTLLAVHNFDGTLIIDDAEDESNYDIFHQSDDDNSNTRHGDYVNTDHRFSDERISGTSQSTPTLLPPSSQSLALALSPNNTIDAPQRDKISPDALSMLSNIVQSTNNDANQSGSDENHEAQPSSALLSPPMPPREYVQWKFQDLNMILGHDTLVFRPPNSASSEGGGGIAVRVEDVRFLQSVWEAFQRQQKQQQHALLGNNRSYAQAVLQNREIKSSLSSESKEMPNTTTAVLTTPNITTTTTTTTKNLQENDSKSNFSEIPLNTCIVPYPGPVGGTISPLDSSPSPISTDTTSASPGPIPTSSESVSLKKSMESPALSIVLDAYLDNLMTNVPQLALCLEEKGLIQSVKMLPTEEIPSKMLHPSTLDTSRPLDVLSSRGGDTDDGKRANMDGSSASPKFRRSHHRRRSSDNQFEESVFSPQMMETNASALLRFLKTNCTRNHATYLLRYEELTDGEGSEGKGDAPPQNIQLYDISSISAQKQKKWIWWLATMSYRFALRLRHLETSSEASFPGSILSESQKRAIRDRQRSLFQQTLDLLQDLMDIDGKAHESMVASVREHMADTYLSSITSNSAGDGGPSETSASAERAESKPGLSEMSPSPPVVTATLSAKGPPSQQLSSPSSPTKTPTLPNSENAPAMPLSDSGFHPERHHRQPYAGVSVDALNKAQDHLVRGIKTLSALFERDMEERRIHRETKRRREEEARKRSRRRRQRTQRNMRDEQLNTESEEKEDDGRIPRLSPAMVLQLFGMNFKLVNISLRLVEHHLGNYYSSSAMQALRTAARRLNDAARLLDYGSSMGNRNTGMKHGQDDEKREESLQLQYIWLLEHCGHFARSFASDELWRDRGHASGEDVISVLSDVETVFTESRTIITEADDDEEPDNNESLFWKMVGMDVMLEKSKGKVNLQALSGVVAPFEMSASKADGAVEAAKGVLAKEKLLRRERRRVLVASCISYSRAITAFHFSVATEDETEPAPEKMVLLNLLRQRLGDACNETGKVLLDALRTLLISSQGSNKNDKSQLAAEALLDSAEFWFTHGLEAFDACGDTRNLALLRCNLCQSFKLRANSGFSKRDSSSSSKHAEDCLQKAADQLVMAHEDLAQRETDPQTWDMVSEELAATFLVLGVRRRQSLLGSGNAPVIFQVMRLSPGEERSIVDPMDRALEVYEQSNNGHQAAATHYQLALTFSKLWTCQLNEANTRKKLSKAFEHYSAAFNYFSTHTKGNEPTFCLLCLDLASLYATIPGEEGIMKSLGCCLDCCDTFSEEAISASTDGLTQAKSKADWYDKMETIAQSLDDKVFKLLRSLVKIDSVKYKDMYREGLTAKMVRNVPNNDDYDDSDVRNPKSAALLALHDVLLAIKKKYGVIVSK